jgi:hypothetical protein
MSFRSCTLAAFQSGTWKEHDGTAREAEPSHVGPRADALTLQKQQESGETPWYSQLLQSNEMLSLHHRFRRKVRL